MKVQTEEEKPGYQAAVETTEVTPDSDTAQEDVETACTCETVEVQPENTPSEKNNTENFQEVPKEPVKTVSNKSPEEMTVEELQAGNPGKNGQQWSCYRPDEKNSGRQYLARFPGQLAEELPVGKSFLLPDFSLFVKSSFIDFITGI